MLQHVCASNEVRQQDSECVKTVCLCACVCSIITVPSAEVREREGMMKRKQPHMREGGL